MNTVKNVQGTVNGATVDRVEDLAEHKDVEYQGRKFFVIVGYMEEFWASKVQ